MDWLKQLIWKANRWVNGGIFWSPSTPSVWETQNTTQTLNEQINTWTINTPSQNNTTQFESGFNNTLNGQIASGNISQQATVDNEIDTFSSWLLDPTQQITNISGSEVLRQERLEDAKPRQQKVGDFVHKANKFVDSIIQWKKADSEYQAQEKRVAMWYNPNSWDILYLDLDDSGGDTEAAQDVFNSYFQEFLEKMETPWITAAQQQQAWVDFYDQTKNMFKLKKDDRYKNGAYWQYGRRKDMYSEEQLSALAKNNLSNWQGPSFDEWLTYLETMQDNMSNKQEIYKWYWLASDDDTPTLDLSADASARWHSWFDEIAFKWTADLLNEKIGGVNGWARNQALINYRSAVTNQANRIYQIVAPVYAAEQVVLAKAPSERTEWEKELLETANKFRQMEKAAAEGMNNWMRQEILYWTNSNWDIVESLEIFENWETLSDVLTKEVKRLSWEEWALEKHQSNIDIFSKMANDAMYNYHKGKHWIIRKTWNWVEHVGAPVWDWLWEGWQALIGNVLNLTNMQLTGKVTSATITYMDQDFTVGRLIETNDWNVKRTLKKYLLQWLEYVPEAVGNLAPDIALILATSGTWAWVSIARWGARAPKAVEAVRLMKWASLLEKWNMAKNIVRGTEWAVDTARWVEILSKLTTAARWFDELSSKTKAWLALVDNAITQWIIWQMMDAQWSAYDTEAYSDASFWLSMIGTLAWDVWVELYQWDALSWLKHLVNKNAITNSIWDLADYIDSSPEAAEYIAKVLQKKVPDISFNDLRTYVKNFWAVERAAKEVYDWLSAQWKVAADKWSKEIMFNYVTQAFGSNSQIAKNIRLILANGSTNIADVFKYLWKLPWEVSIWPYVSTIQLKNWTSAAVTAGAKWYDPALDVATWWFDAKLRNWFTQTDLDKISKIDWHSDVNKNKWEWFYKVWDKYYLNEAWAEHFWLELWNLSLESVWVSLADAENVKSLLKEKMKDLKSKRISDPTAEKLADTWGYEEVVTKVKEVLWC